jgi:hypothetical protein
MAALERDHCARRKLMFHAVRIDFDYGLICRQLAEFPNLLDCDRRLWPRILAALDLHEAVFAGWFMVIVMFVVSSMPMFVFTMLVMTDMMTLVRRLLVMFVFHVL